MRVGIVDNKIIQILVSTAKPVENIKVFDGF